MSAAETHRDAPGDEAVPAVTVSAVMLAFVVGQALTVQPWPVRIVAALVLVGTLVWLAISTGWVRR